MFESALKTIESLKLGHVWKVMVLSALITLIIFSCMVWTFVYFLGFIDVENGGWIATLITWLGSGAAFVLSWFLFPVTLPFITYLFLDGIADSVEKRFYPNDTGKSPSFLKTLPADIKLMVVLIVLNILLIPFYLVPVLNIILYYMLNGYLLGREFFELIGLRHKTRKEARELRRKNRFTVLMSGGIIALAATTPILNLFAPVLGTVFMVHVFHKINR